MSTVDAACGETLAVAASNSGPARPALVKLVRLLRAHGVAEAVPELLGGQAHGAVLVGRVLEHGQRGTKSGQWRAEHAFDLGGVDGNRRCAAALTEQLLGEQATEGVADEDGICAEPADDAAVVVHDVVDALVGEGFGVRPGRLHGVGFVWPPWRRCLVAGAAEEVLPCCPRGGVEPEAVDEHDRMGLRCHFEPRFVVVFGASFRPRLVRRIHGSP